MKNLLALAGVLVIMAGGVSMQHLRLTEAPKESEFPEICWNGERVAVAWMDGRDGNQEIYLNTADMDTKSKGEETRLTESANWDDRPNLTWTGKEFGLTYIHERKTKFDLIFHTLDKEGKPSRGPVKIVKNGWLGKDTDIAWTGAGYGIIYSKFQGSTETSQIVFQYVDRKGRKQGDPVTLTSNSNLKVPADILRAGTDFVVVYLDETEKNVYFMKIDPFGNPKGEKVQLNLPDTDCKMPSAATKEEKTLVSWPQQTAKGQQVMVSLVLPTGKRTKPPEPVTEPGAERPSVEVAEGKGGFGLTYIENQDKKRTLFFVSLDAKANKTTEPTRLAKPRKIQVLCNKLSMTSTGDGYVIAWVDKGARMNTEVILSKAVME
ncbi:MAG: hypothetical protein R6V10_09250 [bacterium]